MSIIEEQIAKEIKKFEQLKRQKRSKDMKEKNKKKALDTSRQIIIGKLILKHFPEFMHYQPCRTEAENNIEFKPVINLLTMLADDKQYVLQLKKKVFYKMLPVNKKD